MPPPPGYRPGPAPPRSPWARSTTTPAQTKRVGVIVVLVVVVLVVLQVVAGMSSNKTSTVTSTTSAAGVADLNAVPPSSLKATTFTRSWSAPLDEDPAAAPITVASNGVFVAFPNEVRAYDPDTGAERWRHDGAGSAPNFVVAGDMVVVVEDRTLVGLTAATGATTWRQSMPAAVTLPLVADASTVLAVASGLEALEPRTGATRWTSSAPPIAAPAIDPTTGTALVPAAGHIDAFELESGIKRFQVSASTTPGVTPAASGVTTYFDTTDNSILSVTGQVQRSIIVPGKTRAAHNLAGDGLGGVIVSLDDGTVGGLAAARPAVPWATDVAGTPPYAGAVSSSRALVVEPDQIRAVQPAAGLTAGALIEPAGTTIVTAGLPTPASATDTGHLVVATRDRTGHTTLTGLVVTTVSDSAASRTTTVGPTIP
jgi:outer membrane protein assembly factor BamB